MMFTGHAELTIDSKGRLAIPAKYRNKWDAQRDGSGWYCVAWPDRTLRLYTEVQFEDLAKQLDESLMPADDEAALERSFFNQAEPLQMDSAGRVMLPKRHQRRTGLTLNTEVVLIGARNRLEVHHRDAWNEQDDAMFEQIPAMIKQMKRRGQQMGTS